MPDNRGLKAKQAIREAVALVWECAPDQVEHVVTVATTPDGAIGIVASTIGVHPTLYVLEQGIASLLERGEVEGEAIT